ncbi:pyridoxal phosphate-dependent transferase [Fimicolochytrium jonesii]|uniref:pyridoxal phosphate-dependent transferase n=1 Tax=Fimicolochytrium jonesii TaxID=1396493 RepID=UPI0022FE8606|nr:pyridoxal phosphate-dependent transferase [Fimicolochytrium jonesii]KAI8826180.1 pyridoxal phosphate-dependent transferase [Fimicolochytrium jonesii]
MYPESMSLHLTGRKYYEILSRELNHPIDSAEFAAALDARDPLRHLRSQFHIPLRRDCVPEGQTETEDPDAEAIYLCGNSLGLQPKHTRKLVDEELDVWATLGVQGHFRHPENREWVTIDDHVVEESAKVVGAKPSEVAIMNSLTVNLHFLMVSFYRPTQQRYKILMESKSFPSDYYAIESQVKHHNFPPSTAIIQLSPREGEHTLRTQDIVDAIEREGESIALVMFSGVQYYTGQFFDLHAITSAAKAKGCVVGYDLAHAAGNVPLKLHDWGVDFACWCTYKYLNAGPGGIGGAFVHERHARADIPRLAGWWGTDPATKFDMSHTFAPIPSALSFRVSNPSVLATVSLLGSLRVFAQTTMEDIRAKSVLLTGYLEVLLDALDSDRFTQLTPRDPAARGCQLSLLFREEGVMMKVFEALCRQAVIVDERKPDVVRVSPAPLYNTYAEVWRFVRAFRGALETVSVGGDAVDAEGHAEKGFVTL